MPTIQLPTYEIELPISKQKITYRPFVVKEEKLLLLAMVERDVPGVVKVIKEILTACTFNKLDVNAISKVDMEYLFIKTRNSAFGEGLDVTATCPHCNHEQKIILNMDKVEVVKPREIKPEIEIMANHWVTLRFPTLEESAMLDGSDESAIKMIAQCMVNIIINEDSHDVKDASIDERQAFLDSITEAQLLKLAEFFQSLPKLVYSEMVPCTKCRGEIKIYLEGLETFFD